MKLYSLNVDISARACAGVRKYFRLVDMKNLLEKTNKWARRRIISCFVSKVCLGDEDRILTLSAYSYEFNDARFVLHGIVIQILAAYI